MKSLEGKFRLILIIGLGWLLLSILLHPLFINWDVSLFIEIAHRILEGQLPYVDYFEINFPVSHYLHVIPVVLSQLTGIHEITMTLLSIWVLCIWSAWACLSIGQYVFDDEVRTARYIIPICLMLYSSWWAVVPQFGQRENLFLLFFLPAFLLRIVHWQPTPSPTSRVGDFAVGFLGAIGATVKPHFLLPVMMVELYGLLFVHRSWRRYLHAEVLGFVLFGVLHVLYFLLLPQVLQGLLETAALAAVGHIAYGNPSLIELLSLPSSFRALLVFSLALLIQRKNPTPLAIVTKAMAVYGIGGFIIFAIQDRGFTYHQEVYHLAELAVLCLLVYQLVLALDTPHSAQFPLIARFKPQYLRFFRTFFAILIPVLSVVGIIPILIGWFLIPPPDNNGVLQLIQENTQPGEGILVLNYLLRYNNYPQLQQINRRQSASHLVAYPYYMGIAANSTARINQWMEVVRQDIEKQQPMIIVMPFDMRAYLDGVGFIEANINPHYLQVYEEDGQIVYLRQTAN